MFALHIENVCCGASPGRLTRGELYDLVSKSKINTFVCLQESYTEYDCSDYRETLEQMSKITVCKIFHRSGL